MGRCGIRSCKFDCFLTANEIANSYSEICLQRHEKRQERILHRPINKYTDVFRIFVRFTNLFHKLKYIGYIKKYRRFYFCYYFSVVVKICEVFSDYLRVYVSLVCVKLPTLG